MNRRYGTLLLHLTALATFEALLVTNCDAAEPLDLEPCASMAGGSYSGLQTIANGYWILEQAGLTANPDGSLRVFYFPGKAELGERIATIDRSGRGGEVEVVFHVAKHRLFAVTVGERVKARRPRRVEDMVQTQILAIGKQAVRALAQPIEDAMTHLQHPRGSKVHTHATVLDFVKFDENRHSQCGRYRIATSTFPDLIEKWTQVFGLLDLPLDDRQEALSTLEAQLSE